jgi:hypothetical protein
MSFQIYIISVISNNRIIAVNHLDESLHLFTDAFSPQEQTFLKEGVKIVVESDGRATLATHSFINWAKNHYK